MDLGIRLNAVYRDPYPQSPDSICPSLPTVSQRFFHMHLVSDATGETLNTVARAAAAHYADYRPIEHIYALVRTEKQLTRVLTAIEREPGVVLFTIVERQLRLALERRCAELAVPCISILDPVIANLAKYLNAETRPQIGGQHVLNEEYFRRIDALNFTMAHDDGLHPEDLEEADVVLAGISRTSKTPTSIYLANRGVKTANVPIVPLIPPPTELEMLKHPLVVGLIASTERIAQMRRHRLLAIKEERETSYADETAIASELANMRRLCAKHGWPLIDVTRRSIEETAAAIINLMGEREAAT
jgi:[pyruvate, water dikinase]-phosphate phosphotransferase / [pyruvate, water dikinase] kinase